MAQIVFVLESIPPLCDPISHYGYRLACSLAEQQHHVTIITSYSNRTLVDELPPRVEILNSFEKWSIFEAPKVLINLMRIRPDVLHLMQPLSESKIYHLHSLIFDISEICRIPIRALSIVEDRPLKKVSSKLNGLRHLIDRADLVTASQASMTEKVRNLLGDESVGKIISSLPAFFPLTLRQSAHSQTFSPKKNNGLLLCLPFDLSDHINLEELSFQLTDLLKRVPDLEIFTAGDWTCSPRRRLAFLQTFDSFDLGKRFKIWGKTAPPFERLDECNKRSFSSQRKEVAFLGPLGLSFNFLQTLPHVLSSNRLILLNTSQMEQVDQFCDDEDGFNSSSFDQHNGIFNVGSKSRDLEREIRKIQENASYSEKNFENNFQRKRKVLDVPGNVLNRLYQKALIQT